MAGLSRPQARWRAGLVSVALLGGGCAHPAGVLDLADARTDEERASGLREAAEVLADEGRPVAYRVAGALTLGRLFADTPTSLAALRTGLGPAQPEPVRDAAAWALGRARGPQVVGVLVESLEDTPPPPIGRRVMQSLLHHQVELEAAPRAERIRVAEALARYGGTVEGESVPPEVDLLGGLVRDLAVDVAVVDRAVEARGRRDDAETRAALYAATVALLARIRRATGELSDPQLTTEALDAAVEAARAGDPGTARMVVAALGELGSVAPRAAARGVLDIPLPAGPGHRLIRAWALARIQLSALEARRSLGQAFLTEETDPGVLRAVDASRGRGAEDILQRVLGLSWEDR